jgi:hypothetical protein
MSIFRGGRGGGLGQNKTTVIARAIIRIRRLKEKAGD